MNVLLINYHHLDSNSGIHIFQLANHLSRLGVACTVCVPDHKDAVRLVGVPLFSVIDFEEARRTWWRTPDGRETDLIHVWTPREVVRGITQELAERLHCPYIVHLEDNELAILAASVGLRAGALGRLDSQELDRLVASHLAHPLRARRLLEGAGGVTALMDTLLSSVPEGIPTEVFWPGYDEGWHWDLPDARARRERMGIAEGEFVVVYTGNVHAANRDEVFSLYLAIALLNRRGVPTRLLRTGTDYVPLIDDSLAAMRQCSIELGHVRRAEIPSLLMLADILVQPGRSGEFNDYRFPAKLPEFLASGRPVLLPGTNLGRFLGDGEECVLLKEGNALEISRQLERLFSDPDTRQRIGAGGRAFAQKHLRWGKAADKLLAFYSRLLEGTKGSGANEGGAEGTASFLPALRKRTDQPLGRKEPASQALWVLGPLSLSGSSEPPRSKPTDLRHLAVAYATRPVEQLSYATVRDYCDSLDHLPALASMAGDLKDVQRPWALKAILATLTPGSHLLEIGAGEPIVAQLLAELGYEITIVDPYDGSGNGPKEYEFYTKAYPQLHFVRDRFSDRIAGVAPGSIDGVYSISVLEHVPSEGLADVMAGTHRFLRPQGGRVIHAIDHVLRGGAADFHLERLQTIMEGMGFGKAQLLELLAKCEADPETYFLSPSGHNLWRGGRPYAEFPMRRVVSVQVCMGLGGDAWADAPYTGEKL